MYNLKEKWRKETVSNSTVSERRLLWQQLGQMTSSTLTRIPLHQSSGTKLISTKKDTLKWMSFFSVEEATTARCADQLVVLYSARFRCFKLLSHHQFFISLVCSFKKIEKIYTFYKQSYIESNKQKKFLSYSYRKRKAVCVSHTIHIFISKCVVRNTRFAERRKIGKKKKNDFHVYKP